MTGQRNPEDTPHKSVQLKPQVCNSESACSLSTRTHFPPNKGFTTFCLCVKIHFYTAEGTDACPWSLGFTVLTAAV